MHPIPRNTDTNSQSYQPLPQFIQLPQKITKKGSTKLVLCQECFWGFPFGTISSYGTSWQMINKHNLKNTLDLNRAHKTQVFTIATANCSPSQAIKIINLIIKITIVCFLSTKKTPVICCFNSTLMTTTYWHLISTIITQLYMIGIMKFNCDFLLIIFFHKWHTKLLWNLLRY